LGRRLEKQILQNAGIRGGGSIICGIPVIAETLAMATRVSYFCTVSIRTNQCIKKGPRVVQKMFEF